MSIPVDETSLGGCFLGDQLIKCAWSATECLNMNLSFKSATEPLGSGRCDDNHRDIIGMCVDETLCTTDASNCNNPDQFIEEFPFCSVEYNRNYERVRGTQFALWGKCFIDGVGTCVWSKDDCPDGGTFQTPYELDYYSPNPLDLADKSDDICTCEFTRVGACKADDGYHCAVSADSCGPESTWLSWQNTLPYIECNVCSPFKHKTRNEFDSFIYNYGRTPPKETSNTTFFLFSLLGFGIGVVFIAFLWRCCSSKSSKGEESTDSINMTETSRDVVEEKEIA